MLYIFMLGYDVDFGHMEAVSLISAPKYPEKQVLFAIPTYFLHFLFKLSLFYLGCILYQNSFWIVNYPFQFIMLMFVSQ